MEHPGNVRCRNLILSLLEETERETPSSSSASIAGLVGGSNHTVMISKYHNDNVDRVCFHIEVHRSGQFLEWDKRRSSWIQMEDRSKIKQKVSVLFHSVDRRYRRTPASRSGSAAGNKIFVESSEEDEVGTEANNYDNKTNLEPYTFLEGGKEKLEKQQCCETKFRTNNPRSPGDRRKRSKRN